MVDIFDEYLDDPDSIFVGEHITDFTRFLYGTVFFYLTAPIYDIQLLPDVILTVYSVGLFLFWIGFPYALYKDKQYVSERTEWTPSKLYYLGVLPGYLGVGVIVYYIFKRRKVFEKTDGNESVKEVVERVG